MSKRPCSVTVISYQGKSLGDLCVLRGYPRPSAPSVVPLLPPSEPSRSPSVISVLSPFTPLLQRSSNSDRVGLRQKANDAARIPFIPTNEVDARDARELRRFGLAHLCPGGGSENERGRPN